MSRTTDKKTQCNPWSTQEEWFTALLKKNLKGGTLKTLDTADKSLISMYEIAHIAGATPARIKQSISTSSKNGGSRLSDISKTSINGIYFLDRAEFSCLQSEEAEISSKSPVLVSLLAIRLGTKSSNIAAAAKGLVVKLPLNGRLVIAKDDAIQFVDDRKKSLEALKNKPSHVSNKTPELSVTERIARCTDTIKRLKENNL